MARVKIGVVGFGHIGKVHVNAILADKELFELTAILTQNPEKLPAELKPFAVKDGEAFAKTGARLAIICTPTGTHAEVSAPLMACGVNILTEKPIDSNIIT